MTKSEMALLLAKAAAFDARTIGDADVEAWHDCVGDLDFAESMRAVTRHYRHTASRLMPCHLVPGQMTGPERWD